MRSRLLRNPAPVVLALVAGVGGALAPAPMLAQSIPSAHVYHCHMPNFWPFFAVSNAAVLTKYNALAVGAPIRYTSDGDVINLKNSPPTGYTYYLPSSVGTGIMPHDDLVSYYSANAKYACYQGGGWPMGEAEMMHSQQGAKGQVHVTYSGALATNVNSIELDGNIGSYYTQGSGWNGTWISDFNNLTTQNGYKTMDMIHFAGHHCLAPLIGSDYLLKDLIFHGATLAQPWFLGSNYVSSHGYFPTEESFSERIIPVLAKLGVSWSVMGNNHFSHTLTDYPYATYDASGDAMISPPNRADLRNTSSVGSWLSESLTNQAQNIVNKFPFASTPHWVRYVDPMTGVVAQIAGIPTSQTGQWAEGYLGSVTVGELVPYASLEPRQFFVLAHDGDNSSGRSGSWDTWQAGISVTGASPGFCEGIDEYLKATPIPATDVQHVQDGSWADVLDASTDPMFYHWHLPPCIWKTQFAAMNAANGTSLAAKTNLAGTIEGCTVNYENGWHYQELAFAKLMAPLNYAKTAEQIWLDNHPSYWSPTTTLDHQVTYAGNQLNPWMIAAPVKGNPSADYAGGANPAELAWYFLLPAMDSGFGYYGENEDDDVKPVLAFNNSLQFSQPYVTSLISEDRTGPSVWIPQVWPQNPGSVNDSKTQGNTLQWYNSQFSVYTYAYDASGMASVNVMVRPHAISGITAADDTYKVIYPANLAGTSGLSITPGNVGAWTAYPMQMRDMHSCMNGVAWVPTDQATMAVIPTLDTGNLYYAYLNQYKNQLVDYYIQATDKLGNITDTDVQQVYVGAGTYNTGGTSGYTESTTGTIQGTAPFIGAISFATATTALPDFLPASGAYPTAQTVKILDATPGAVIYYTTNGATPTTASTQYSGPFVVTGNTTVKAIAVASGLPQSGLSGSTYILGALPAPTAMPTISPAAGIYAAAQSITLADSSTGAVIYYTTDGSTPTTASATYKAAIPVSVTTTINAMAVAPGLSNSGVASSLFRIGAVPAAPMGLAATGASGSTMSVTWTATTGATSYTVTRSTSSTGTFTQVGTPTTSSFTDTGLSSGTAYYYQVTATNAIGTSTSSAVATGTTTGFKAAYNTMYLRGTMSATIWDTSQAMALIANDTWAYTATLAASTAYTYKFDTGAWTTGQNWGAGGTAGLGVVNSGTDIPFTSSTAGSYQFTFNDLTLAFTVAQVSSTKPAAPTSLTAAAASATQINLTWPASSGATSYTVYQATASAGPFTTGVGTVTTNSFAATGLKPATAYYFQVSAANTAGTSANSITATATTPVAAPVVPVGLTATAASSSQINLTWTASAGATSYTIYRATTSAGPFTTSVGTSTTASFASTGLANGTTYYYEVSATNAGGTSDNSVSASATTPATVPVPPASPVATAASATQINLTWTASAGATSYTIYRATSSAGPFTTALATSTTASYASTGLTANTTYYYQISAANTAGTSANSATASATTTGNFTSPYSKMYLRGTMSATTWDTSMAMALVANDTWKYSVNLAASTTYTFKFDASGVWTSGQDWGGTGTGASGTAVVNGGNLAYTSTTAGTYTFTFVDNTLGYSILAPGVTVPAAPTSLAATAASSTQVNLTWTASAGATSYTIYRATSSAGPFTTSIGTSTTASFSSTGLTAGTTYFYQVSATNAAGTSPDSATASTTTKFASNYAAMYLRGTENAWGATAMALVANNTWKVSVTLTPATSYQFKFEIGGGTTWSTNWGNPTSSTTSASSGTATLSSSYNMYYTTTTATGYTFTFNDATAAYTITAP